MKTLYKNLTILGILAGITLTSLPIKSEPTNAVSELVRGNNTFALELYGKLKSKEGNLFFSPYSVSTCLGMVYAGARGETEKQMANTLHFNTNQAALYAGFGELQKQLNEKSGVTLKVANALLAQDGLPFRIEFLDHLKETYQAEARRFDFRTQAQVASDEMNRWVREKTEGKIADVLSPEKLQDVSLVVLNAIYFKGAWAEPFSEGMTTPLPFYLGSTGSVTAQVMDQEAHFHYFENPELKALELPYVGGKMSMVILLPKLKEGLPDLETSLSADKLSVWINLMRAEDVIVQMPKFKMEKQFELTPTLNEMGLRDALCSKADFSGITSPGGLYVSAVSHKSFVEVNEKGTEAAAVTAAWAAFGNVEKPAPKTFFANHPFLFLIRDNGTGSILFMGRVMDPTK